MDGFEINISVNGITRRIQSIADLKEATEFISHCLRWKTAAGGNIPQEKENPQSNINNTPSLPTLEPLPTAADVKLTMRDYAVIAAERLGGLFLPAQLAAEMLSQGWTTRAKEKRTMQSAVRGLIANDKRFSSAGKGYWRFTKTV